MPWSAPKWVTINIPAALTAQKIVTVTTEFWNLESGEYSTSDPVETLTPVWVAANYFPYWFSYLSSTVVYDRGKSAGTSTQRWITHTSTSLEVTSLGEGTLGTRQDVTDRVLTAYRTDPDPWYLYDIWNPNSYNAYLKPDVDFLRIPNRSAPNYTRAELYLDILEEAATVNEGWTLETRLPSQYRPLTGGFRGQRSSYSGTFGTPNTSPISVVVNGVAAWSVDLVNPPYTHDIVPWPNDALETPGIVLPGADVTVLRLGLVDNTSLPLSLGGWLNGTQESYDGGNFWPAWEPDFFGATSTAMSPLAYNDAGTASVTISAFPNPVFTRKFLVRAWLPGPVDPPPSAIGLTIADGAGWALVDNNASGVNNPHRLKVQLPDGTWAREWKKGMDPALGSYAANHPLKIKLFNGLWVEACRMIED